MTASITQDSLTTAEDTGTSDLRIITDGGDLVDYTAYADPDDAFHAFQAVIPLLHDGEIAQLIEADLIAFEHNPEYHGTAAHNLAYYA
ncbi:hypothetical protein [Brachybacterium tyrofermentans]|uniref:hypothetical protein n=1 Tax=Brachybacterium tyrofermentans TaxID=47848 RepID=UPI001866B748|nr:hypothetical protein [Brachybacterium tyrofermentans]